MKNHFQIINMTNVEMLSLDTIAIQVL